MFYLFNFQFQSKHYNFFNVIFGIKLEYYLLVMMFFCLCFDLDYSSFDESNMYQFFFKISTSLSTYAVTPSAHALNHPYNHLLHMLYKFTNTF